MFNFRYGLWRTMTLRQHIIEFSLMEAGHTKFHPDWHFGLWKVRWRGSTVETMTEMAESVSQSSRGGHNIPQLVDDQDSPVHFYDWIKLETQTDSKLAHDIKKRKCSHCKQLGHCMSKGGKIKCPD